MSSVVAIARHIPTSVWSLRGLCYSNSAMGWATAPLRPKREIACHIAFARGRFANPADRQDDRAMLSECKRHKRPRAETVLANIGCIGSILIRKESR
jgi:hypothetical protein